jgi:hypothetical protein
MTTDIQEVVRSGKKDGIRSKEANGGPPTAPGIASASERNDAVQLLKQKWKEGTVTLLYAARDEAHNEALVLKGLLQGR